MWSAKGDRTVIDRVVQPRWLEVVFAVAIILVGGLGWKLIIVDVWLGETDEQSIGVAQTFLTAKNH